MVDQWVRLGMAIVVTQREEVQAEIARLQAYGVDAAFAFGSDQDRKNSSEVIAGAYQGGLGLPDRDYYTKTDDESKALREKYVAHMTNMFVLLGESAATAAESAKTVMSLETRLAEASMTNVEQRDPDKTYHRKSLDELAQLTPNFSWTTYLHDTGAPPVTAVNVGMPKYFEALNKELLATPLPHWKTYLRWHVIHAAAPQLPKRFVDENFAFYGAVLEGTPENEVRWKRCVSATDGLVGFALGKVYVREYFPPEAKARADEMVRNLIAALRDDLTSLSWMSEATRQAAIAKLDAFGTKIGYPDKWRDYSALAVNRGPYIANVARANQFEFKRDLAKIGKPVDRTEWGMTPPTVDAYNSSQKNEIAFPAGILQPPFFDPKADDAVNYGAMGSVIGHEMTHGFDDQGRKFDAQGNMRDWWTAEDSRNFDERAACIIRQFDGYFIEPEIHQNGALVQGESIADLGGLTIAYRAYKKSLEGKSAPQPVGGLTPDQRFFVSNARIWASNHRPEFARLMVATNEHPLGKFRAIGTIGNMPEFARAFGCGDGTPMVRAARCQIW